MVQSFKKILNNGLIDLLECAGLLSSKLGIEPVLIRTPRIALEQWKLNVDPHAVPGKGRIAIVAFRNRTWVEWAIFAAHYIFRMGYQPVLIYSQKEMQYLYPKKRILEKLGFDFWGEILRLPYIEKVDLDNNADPLSGTQDSYEDFAKDFAPTIAAYDLKVEEFEEDVEPAKYQQQTQEVQKTLLKQCVAVERVLKHMKFDRLVCPSGLMGLSAAILEVTRRFRINAVFVEAWAMRPGHMLWAFNQPALTYDIKGWMNVLGGWDEEKEKDAEDFLRFQERESVVREDWLEDFHPVQRIPKNTNLPGNLKDFLNQKGPLFLLGTNVVGDSSILRRSTIFKNQKQWLRKVIDFFSRNSHLRLIVRAHPDEAWQRAKIKIGEFTAGLAGQAANIFVIKATDDINTYALMEYAQAGLAWVSNIGLDMVLRGKPVLMAASPKYDDLGIVYCPKTQEEYFQRILEYAKDPPIPSQATIRTAKLYQRIIFKEMSLEASSKHYVSTEYRLGKNRMHRDQEKFYKILTGKLDRKGHSRNPGTR